MCCRRGLIEITVPVKNHRSISTIDSDKAGEGVGIIRFSVWAFANLWAAAGLMKTIG